MTSKEVQDLGRQFEVFVPYWNRNLGVTIFGLVFTGIFLVFGPPVIKFIFGIFFLVSLYFAWKAFVLKGQGIWFHENGLVVKNSTVVKELGGPAVIPLSTIEDFRWECHDTTEVTGGSVERWVDLQFFLAWSDEDGNFREIQWNESFPPGTDLRLSRACSRMDEIDQQAEAKPQDEFWDE